MKLQILICTHNRLDLLARTIDFLNAAKRPVGWQVELMVVANACTDGTRDFLAARAGMGAGRGLPMLWVEERTPGKSNALNHGIQLLTADIVAFVDDDHRVDTEYLISICRAAEDYPEATMFCGRILPDWDGSEPAWVHETGPYRVYPLPVPRYDQGMQARELTFQDPFPGGGNLFLRGDVFDRIGGFSTELGPTGHDLGGGEDSDFVQRALTRGERLRYVPQVMQYHYVDLERFKLRYLLQKSYQRSRSVARVHHADGSVPLYMWRKLMGYVAAAVFSLSWSRTRFYLVRVAAALGEMRGMAGSPTIGQKVKAVHGHDAPGMASVATAMGTAMAASIMVLPASAVWESVLVSGAIGALFTLALLIKSINDFSQTGPQIRKEIQKHYTRYSLFAVARLGFWSLTLSSLMAGAGVAVYACHSISLGQAFSLPWAAAAAVLGILSVTGIQFLRHLLYLPATIAASSHYRLSRFYPLWRWLSPAKLRIFQVVLVALGGAATLVTAVDLVVAQQWPSLAILGALCISIGAGIRLSAPRRESPASRSVPGKESSQSPNIIMIGSDTLRADRLGAAGYSRQLTPHLDALAKRGVQFTNCYVPCARTAPSLISLLTGTWPHTHGIRDNFVGDDEVALPAPGLPGILAKMGYQTAVIGDWAAADMAKFDLGFEMADLPEDQWNIKYLIRQGPKDLRLFLSLFTHNRFGKRFLPELYYLAGVPLTREVGRDARAMITDLANDGRPFLLNVFMAATHPPFGSEYPYYTLFSQPDYQGESKFVMARLTDPFEIIRRQGDSKKEFDLDQILALYDGCVRNFDDEVARILAHIRASALEDNTIIVIYSDHGMEFFEHDTWGQGNSVAGDFSPKVPLIIVDPRRQGGQVVTDIVRTVDVAPTLAQLLDIPKPPHMEGVSLVPYLDCQAASLDLPAFAETGIWLTDLPGMPAGHLRYPNLLELLEVHNKESGTLAIKPEYKRIIIAAKDRMIRKGRWKVVYQPLEKSQRVLLFDLENDAECRRDIAGDHPEIVRELWGALQSWITSDPVCYQCLDKSDTMDFGGFLSELEPSR